MIPPAGVNIFSGLSLSENLVDSILYGIIIVSGSCKPAAAVGTVAPSAGDDFSCKLLDRFFRSGFTGRHKLIDLALNCGIVISGGCKPCFSFSADTR